MAATRRSPNTESGRIRGSAPTSTISARGSPSAFPSRIAASSRPLPYSASFGDFFFCHAGIRPGVPLAEQSIDDLTWIRDEFLFDPRDHGVVVVHGHTPVPRPELRANRIDIDTGAVFTGNLTTLVLEGTRFEFL